MSSCQGVSASTTRAHLQEAVGRLTTRSVSLYATSGLGIEPMGSEFFLLTDKNHILKMVTLTLEKLEIGCFYY
jgi:hypothetical protein